MAPLNTLFEARTIHAYTAVVVLAVVFNLVGLIGLVQVLGVTLFFGFVALIDAVEGLSRSIDSVDGQLERVTGQLNRVNDDGQDQGRERDS